MYLITGAGGFLGSYIIKHILSETDDRVIAVTSNGLAFGSDNSRVSIIKCNIIHEAHLLYDKVRHVDNVKVIHLAAQHNIDMVAHNPDEAFKINVKATEGLIHNVDYSSFFFASSDTVYGEGGEHKFCESDELNPLSVYGRHKILGEKTVISGGGNVLRLPFMFSESLSPSKKHFSDVLISKLSRGEKVEMFTNSVRSTLTFDTVADVFVRLCEEKTKTVPTVLNVGGDNAMSKYDVGVKLAEKYGFDKSLIIPLKYCGKWEDGAKRSEYTIMDNSKLKDFLETDKIVFDLNGGSI